jgi:thymidine kinase
VIEWNINYFLRAGKFAMAQLFYRYSSMNAGKSLELIKIAYNYEEQGKKTVILTAEIDDRYAKGYVASRAGIKREAIPYTDTTSIINIIQATLSEGEEIHCILVDEGQFLTERQVKELTQIVDYMNIPVIVYGLKNDFQNNLFEGSQALLIYADKIEEIKTVCWFCDKKATMVLRIVNGKPVYTGEQVMIGGNSNYLPVCRKCYGSPKLPTASQSIVDADIAFEESQEF